ncbi:MAG: hypothetical protein AAF432_08035 [Planctomycetota bacterium]
MPGLHRVVVGGASIACIAIGMVAFAQDRPATAPKPAPEQVSAPEAVDEPTFGDAMGEMMQALRRLSRSPLDASSLADDLAYVDAIQAGLVHSKMTLDTVKKSSNATSVHGDDHAAYAKAFRAQLHAGLAVAVELESALLDGDGDAARAQIPKLKKIRDDGHRDYQARQW